MVIKLGDLIDQSEKKNREIWESAKNALRNGDKVSAKNFVLRYQHGQRSYLAKEKQRWILESYVEKIEIMKVDVMSGTALQLAGQFIKLDVDAIRDEMSILDDKFAGMKELSDEWDRLFTTASKVPGYEEIPSEQTLMNDLISELKGPEVAAPASTIPVPTIVEKEKQIENLKTALDNL